MKIWVQIKEGFILDSSQIDTFGVLLNMCTSQMLAQVVASDSNHNSAFLIYESYSL